jgi:hypothetical protein
MNNELFPSVSFEDYPEDNTVIVIGNSDKIITNLPFIETLFINGDVSATQFEQIVKLNTLKKLVITGKVSKGMWMIAIHSTTQLPLLEHIELESDHLDVWHGYFPSLKILKVAHVENEINLYNMKNSNPALASLEEFHLLEGFVISDLLIRGLSSCKKLKRIVASYATINCPLYELSACESLEVMELFDIEVSTSLLQYCKKLRRIYITNSNSTILKRTTIPELAAKIEIIKQPNWHMPQQSKSFYNKIATKFFGKVRGIL